MIRIVRKFAILFAVLTAQLYTAAAYYAWSLPDSYYTADSILFRNLSATNKHQRPSPASRVAFVV